MKDPKQNKNNGKGGKRGRRWCQRVNGGVKGVAERLVM
jgi:hypothetical protein